MLPPDPNAKLPTLEPEDIRQQQTRSLGRRHRLAHVWSRAWAFDYSNGVRAVVTKILRAFRGSK